jgi:ParB/RepB/Spo0J family partition protein
MNLRDTNRKQVFQRIKRDLLFRDPNNPRKAIAPEKLKSLAESIALHDIQVPLIVVLVNGKYQVIDGHSRLDASEMIKLDTLPCITLEEMPSLGDLLLIQTTINCQRNDLDPISKAESFASLMRLKNWSASDVAGQTCLSNSTISLHLTLLTLDPEIQLAIRESRLPASSGYSLARMTPEQRAETWSKLKAGQPITRDDLNKAARKKTNRTTGKRASRMAFKLPQSTLTFVGQLSVEGLIAELSELLKRAKQALHDQLDITTLAKVLGDQAKKKTPA